MLTGILKFSQYLGSRLKQWTKPATATLVRGTIADMTRSQSDLLVARDTTDMCGACRKFFRDAAFKQKKQYVVADPNFTRAFNPDGTVHIYTKDGRFVRTIPAGKDPRAGRKRNYVGVEL